MEKSDFDLFCDDVEKITDMIDQKRSLQTRRKGKEKKRDWLVLFKTTWAHAEQWAALPRAIVYWLALTAPAILGFNGGISVLERLFPFFPLFSFRIPLEYGSFIAVMFVLSLMAFGIFAHRKLGLRKGVNELSIKQNPGWFMAWLMWKELKELKESEKR